MKKLVIILMLSYLSLTINSAAETDNSDEKILKIGILVPLSGENQEIGKSVLKAAQLALFDIGDENIKILPKDSASNPDDTYLSAMELKNLGVKVVIGPIFHENLKKLNEIDGITFISLTNKTENLPKNTISFGINVYSQLLTIKKYIETKKISKTLLLFPESEFSNLIENSIQDNNFNFYKKFSYSTNPKKITAQIETITEYNQRKINLKARVKKLEKSDLLKDKRELKKLEQKYTLGKVEFESVIIADFGERLKSVLSSFNYADVSSEEVKFFTLNQWFDEGLFDEMSLKNLFFPSIKLNGFNKFRKKYYKEYKETPVEISILSYDAFGLIYTLWRRDNKTFKISDFYLKSGFKGLHGEFFIKKNLSEQKLNIYKISENKFIKVH